MSLHSKDIGDIFTSDLAVGSSSGGEDFSLIGSTRKCIEEITFYVVTDEHGDPQVKKSIGQIRVRKSDGTCITVGAVKTTVKATLVLKPHEKLTKIQLMSYEDRLVGVDIRTDKKQHLSVQIPNLPSGIHPTEIPVGTGEFVGVFGRSGLYVDSLGFAMLKS